MNNIELSIQVNLNGFSFLARNDCGELANGSFAHYDFGAIGQFSDPVGRVKIYCSVSSSLVVPAECFDQGMACHYLRAANMFARQDVALWSSVGSVFVVWAIDQQIYSSLNNTYPQIEWLHPLVEICGEKNVDVVNIILDHRVAHITVCRDNDMLMAKSVNYTSVNDVLYYATRVLQDEIHGLNRVVVAGVVDNYLAQQLEHYYSSVEVYCDPLFLHRL